VSERIVFAYRYGSLGGPATVLLSRLETFTRRFDVRILFERDLGGVAQFPPASVTMTPTFQSQMDAIRDLKPDLFVAIDAGWREPWIRAGSPGKLIVEVHTASPQLVFLKELQAAQRIDLLIVPSHYLAGILVERGMADIAPIAVVPNSLSRLWFQPVEGWAARTPMLAWIGRLEPHKGIGRFLDICDGLRSIDFLPVLAGGTNDTEEEVTTTAERLYGARRPRKPLWFPRVAHERMPRLYASIARSGGAVVMTSEAESFSMTVAEATLMGSPVIAPAIGGPAELLPPEALFPPGDNDAARALIMKVLSEPGVGSSMTAAARAIVEPLVQPENALAAYLAALERAL
jgi:glycosyltransferase involved in cell wall biosynthesis